MGVAKETPASTFYSPRLFFYHSRHYSELHCFLLLSFFASGGVQCVQWDGLDDVTDANLTAQLTMIAIRLEGRGDSGEFLVGMSPCWKLCVVVLYKSVTLPLLFAIH
jgi:hypothetical protein